MLHKRLPMLLGDWLHIENYKKILAIMPGDVSFSPSPVPPPAVLANTYWIRPACQALCLAPFQALYPSWARLQLCIFITILQMRKLSLSETKVTLWWLNQEVGGVRIQTQASPIW